jgi:LPS-assembly protein
LSLTGKPICKRAQQTNPQFWFADRITSLAKFSALFVLSFLINFNSFARETFEFNLGEKINILSDKAFRKSSDNEFEAVGNVVITHLRNSIYGEKAKISFTTGETEVIGNVRYIAPEMTLYGAKLRYNFLTKEIELDNARVLSDNYSITGKKITQTSANIIYAEEAEYTTCKDCPESWSIFSKRITIEIGEYVKMQHAFIKVNGVTAMYIPYIIFPIKQKRETGVLFPTLGVSNEGFKYQQPFFWAIDDYKDLTFTPSTFGDRGLGGEFQYRQNFKQKTWMEFNSLQLNDQIYEPDKREKTQSGKKTYRHFSDLESHFTYKHYLNSHIYFNDTTDLDTFRDLNYFSKERITGTETGGGGFFEGRSSLFSLGAQSYYNKNMLITDPTKFDNEYVQIMPKITLASTPYNIFHTDYPFLKNLSVGLAGDYTIFRQNRVQTNGPIRNARRLNLAPYMDWSLGNIGPVFFSNTSKLDYQSYKLPTEKDRRNFSKKGIIYETEAAFEIEKVYGLAYIDDKPQEFDEELDEKEKEKKKEEEAKQNTIGALPKFEVGNDEKMTRTYKNSYRHSQTIKLKHYYLSDQTVKGNQSFKEQISQDDGQFDYLDALRDREHIANQVTAQDSLPLSNTIEFQWNNDLIRKRARNFNPYRDGRYLKDNFEYSNIAYFNLSQGIDLTVDSDHLNDRLSRLYMTTGLSFNQIGASIEEFYFHKRKEHKLNTNLSYSFSRAKLITTFTYNSFNPSNVPNAKLGGYDLTVYLSDLFTVRNKINYDFDQKAITESFYSFLYSPINNCWKFEVNFSRDFIEKKVGFLFYINYNDNNFTSINVR